MQYKVHIPNSVKKDIDEIIEYYIDERPDYARKVFDSFLARIDTLKFYPQKGRTVPELFDYNINDYRELIESYWRIIYRIEEDTVIIYTIIDARRNVHDLLIEKLKRKFV